MTARKSLGRSTSVMATGTAVSRVLGFVRNAMVIAAVGVNAGAANAFDVAHRIPNVLYALLASGVLNAVLVPQIVRAFARPNGKRTVDRILTLGATLMFAVTLVFTASAVLLVDVFTDRWTPNLTALAVAFSLWCIPQLFFYGMYTLLGQVLNAREQFGPYMWAPVVNNIVAIGGLTAYLLLFGPYAVDGADSSLALVDDWSAGRIAVLAGTATLGIAAQAAVLIWPLRRGGYRWRWQWSGPKDELSGVTRVAGWALAAVLLEQVGVAWTSRVAAAAAAAGDYATDVAGNFAYSNALLVYLVPHSVVTVSIVTALFTTMSKHAAARDMPALRADLSRGMRVIGVFTIWATAVLLVVAPLAVQVVMPTALPAEQESVAAILRAMSLGLVPLGAMLLVKRVYFALEDGRSVFFIHIPMTVTLVGTALLGQQLLSPRWWVVGIGLGLAASNAVAMVLRLAGLRRRLGGLDGRRVLRTHVASLVAAALPIALGWWLVQRVPDLTAMSDWSRVAAAAGLSIGIAGVMFASYVSLAVLLRVDEVRSGLRSVLAKARFRVR